MHCILTFKIFGPPHDILILWAGTKPVPPAVEAWRPTPLDCQESPPTHIHLFILTHTHAHVLIHSPIDVPSYVLTLPVIPTDSHPYRWYSHPQLPNSCTITRTLCTDTGWHSSACFSCSPYTHSVSNTVTHLHCHHYFLLTVTHLHIS